MPPVLNSRAPRCARDAGQSPIYDDTGLSRHAQVAQPARAKVFSKALAALCDRTCCAGHAPCMLACVLCLGKTASPRWRRNR
eukprot:13985266-Alexandrium_andersonii.AAC.1